MNLEGIESCNLCGIFRRCTAVPPVAVLRVTLNQLCPTRGLRAAYSKVLCGPVSFSLLCIYNTMTTRVYFYDRKFDIFDAMVLVPVYRVLRKGRFRVSTKPWCKIDFWFSDFYSCVPLH